MIRVKRVQRPVQVADVVVGFLKLDRLDDKAINRLLETSRFDYYCWDLYAKVTRWYEGDQARLAFRASVLRDLEAGNNDTANLANSIAKRIFKCNSDLRKMDDFVSKPWISCRALLRLIIYPKR